MMKIQSFQRQIVKLKARFRVISQEFGGKSKKIGGSLATRLLVPDYPLLEGMDYHGDYRHDHRDHH